METEHETIMRALELLGEGVDHILRRLDALEAKIDEAVKWSGAACSAAEDAAAHR